MPSKKLSSRAGAALSVLALLVFLAALALASGLYVNGRLDLTRDRQFTLSEASLKTLKNLEDIVTIKVVMSRDLPSGFQRRRVEAIDLLREFEARSEGKVRLVFENPDDSEEKRQAAEGLGVQEVALQAETRDGVEVKKGFFGLALLYGDRKEVFPLLRGMESFEYDLVVKIKRLTGSVKTIGVVEGTEGNRFTIMLPGEGRPTMVGFEQSFPTLKGEMDRLFDVRPQDLFLAPVDTAVDLLLVAAPRLLDEVEKFRIDQFLMRGKPVIFFTPGMHVHMVDGLTGKPLEDGYQDLLASYGLAVRRNMLLEGHSWEEIRYGTGEVQRPYPYWMVENYSTFSPDNPITARLQSVSFPWASSIEVNEGLQEGLRTEVLIRTTPFAWEEAGDLLLNPRDLAAYEPGEPQSFPLAALKTGRMKSAYGGFAPPGVSPEEAAAPLPVSLGESRVLVISNALFVSDFYLGLTGATGNLIFVLNAFDQLALDPDLIHIRSRQVEESPLDGDAAIRLKTPLILVNMLLAPLLLAGIGIFAGIRRKRRETRA
jgi:ABC-type uncharacterized transport system involved in gliding motility auxiliary subunit